MNNQQPPLFLRAARAATLNLRKIRGGVFVGEIFRRLCGKTPRRVRIDDFDGTLTLDLDLAEHMQSQIFWFGFYSAEIAHVLKEVLRSGDTFIDCGANIGELTLLASKLVGEAGQVIAFEPLDSLADQLDLNLRANRVRNAEVHRIGVFAQSGTAPLFTAGHLFADGTEHRGLGTLFAAPSREVRAATIPLVSLDDFARDHHLNDIRLVKLDIEGAELAALQGARELLKHVKPLLIVEIGRETCVTAGYDPRDIFSFIESFGYRIHRIGRRGTLQPIGIDDLTDFQNVFCKPIEAST